MAEKAATSARARIASVERPMVGDGDGRDQRDDEQRDDELEEREAAVAYCFSVSHDTMSVFSPSPPGAPSAPSDQRS